VIGTTALARSLIVELARTWYQTPHDPTRAIKITVLGDDASSAIAALRNSYPALQETAQLDPVDGAVRASVPLDPDLFAAHGDGFETTVFSCLSEGAESLTVGLQAQRLVRDDSRVVVPASSWTNKLAGLLLADRRIIVVPYAEKDEVSPLVTTREIMARAAHKEYLDGHEARNPTWDELDEGRKNSNRRQVDAMAKHLRCLWYEIVPLTRWNELIRLEQDEIEKLAPLEHARWSEERKRDDWTYAETTDSRAKTHADLRPWEELSPSAKDKDRNAVESWPRILGRAGYGLERSPRRESLAVAIHERHRSDRIDAGESSATSPLLVPWGELDDAQRNLILAVADDIALELFGIGASVVGLSPGAKPAELSEAEIEELARAEHERPDEAATIHPDIHAIPGLLARVGLGLQREPPEAT
jgi:hypothetical protein